MFLKNIPLVLTRATRTLIAKASNLSPRLKASAAFLTLCLIVGAFWIQPALANTAPQPTPAATSLASIADYIWSFFASNNDGRGRIPKPSPVDDGPYLGERQSAEPTPAAALPCSSSGVILNVPGTYPNIQTAINAASPLGGDTIAVAAGTYIEQLSINKCLTIQGAGVGQTIIQSPATLAASLIPGFTNRSIVEARANSYVTINDVTITGPVPFYNDTFGVFVGESATLKMSHARVTAIHQTSGIDGAQDGQGIVAGSVAANTIGSLDLDDVVVDDYQKNGIIVTRNGSTATLNNITVNGMGPTNLIAQNGVQIGDGASATISNSSINDNQYTPNTWAATGLLPVEVSPVTVTNTTFTGNSYAIYEYDSSVPVTPAAFSVTGSTFTNNPGAAILYFAVANPTITDNTISGSNTGIAGYLIDGQTSTIQRNSITNAVGTASTALYFGNYSGTVTTATVNAHFNRISSDNVGGQVGLQNDSGSSVNAENNWWGCNAGPGGTGCDTVTGSGATTYNPWLTLTGITAIPTTVGYGGTSAVSGVTLCINSASTDVCSPTDHTPDGLSLAYTSNPGTAGSVAPPTGTFTTGDASGTTFTAGPGPLVGDQIEAASATFDNETISTNIVVSDGTAPTVSSITLADADPTNAGSVDFTVTFSESVSSVDVADFSLTTTGSISGASVSSVAGSGSVYTVTVSTGSNSGTIRLDVPNTATINDLSGTALSAAFTTGQAYTIDKDGPTGTLAQASGQADPTAASPIHFTVTFSEAVMGFDDTDVTFLDTPDDAFFDVNPTVVVTGGPTTFDIAVSGMNQPGFVRPLVGAGAVTDTAGNSSADVVEGDNSVYYTVGAATLVVDVDGLASSTDCNASFPTAYTTIQSAINAASNGNTIKVCPGTYAENLIVDKQVTLTGPNAGVAGSGSRTAEAIITTPISAPTGASNYIVGIKASGVTVDGFTIDGDNPGLTSGVDINGKDVDAAVGIDSLNSSNVGIYGGGAGHFNPNVAIRNNVVAILWANIATSMFKIKSLYEPECVGY